MIIVIKKNFLKEMGHLGYQLKYYYYRLFINFETRDERNEDSE